MTKRRTGWTAVVLAGLLFAAVLAFMPALAPVFAWAFPGIEPPVYDGETFVTLWLSHAGLVATASLVSAVLAVGLGIFVTRPAGRDFRVLADALATIGQSCPPVAVLAVAVPAVGYGPLPTFIALAIYGLLPILENTIAGLESVPAAVREAATGMGLSPLQVLRQVELPLAGATILAGIRTAVVINIGTATIGSTVGAVTLGTPIIDGLVGDKLPYVVQGAVVVGLFAVFTDLVLEAWGRLVSPPAAKSALGKAKANPA
ncbi:MAG TPA: ABC transporter permease [Alphaproteobacteria bacterium]